MFSLSIIVFILSVTLFTLIFKKFLVSRFFFKKKKWASWLTSFVLAVTTYLVLSYSIVYSVSKIFFFKPKIAFEEKKWTENEQNKYRMIDDLIDSNYLLGKNKEQVKTLLGKPVKSNTKPNTWQYIIAGIIDLSLKSELIYVTIIFDETGKVIKVNKKTRFD